MNNPQESKTWGNPHINYRKNTDVFVSQLLYLCKEG